MSSEELNEETQTTDFAEPEKAPEAVEEVIPSMDEFKDVITESFRKITEGDILNGTIIGISDTEATVDLGSYTEAHIPIDELSNDPRFSIKADLHVGDPVTAVVLREDDGHGNVVLSLKRANDILAWDSLKEALAKRKIYSVRIAQAVNGGVVTYLEGIRAFIPASQLSLSYVENLETWVGNIVDAIVITADAENKKLVLSSKEVEKERAAAERSNRMANLQIGLVTTGIIEKLAPYGVFVNIGDGLSGLVHISQICGKRIESPKGIVKEGQEVKVKIIAIKDGKISLSMKAVEDIEPVDVGRAPIEYHSEGSVSTGLGALLAGIKLD